MKLPSMPHPVRWARLWQTRHKRPDAPPVPSGILRGPRRAALVAIAVLVGSASAVSFAESYRGLWLWASHHGLSGLWADIWPLQVDVFIAVGEVALFVALLDRWSARSRTAAWTVTLAGLAVSVAGNIGHVVTHSLANHVTAAVPPLAAAAALAVGLGVLKRVVEAHHATMSRAFSSAIPTGNENAALMALKATLAAGNPLSINQLAERFSLTRAVATKMRAAVLAEANGQHPPEGGEPPPDQ